MTRRQALALTLAGVAAAPGGASAIAQTGVGLPRGAMPKRETLARLGLDRAWYAAVPFGFGTERVMALNIAEDAIYVQTNRSNLHVFDAETGKYRWGAGLGADTLDARPVAVNSNMVFVTNGSLMMAFDRATGRSIWNKRMEGSAEGAVAANEERVLVGLGSGKLVAFNARDHSKDTPPGRSAGTFAFAWQTRKTITARPIAAGPVVAFASQDSRVYCTTDESKTLLYRFLTGGPIVGSMATHGTRTLIVPSMDGNVYGIDLFTADLKWKVAGGDPFDQEPLVDRDRVIAITTKGRVLVIDGESGEVLRRGETGGGRLLSLSETRGYVLSQDGDLAVIDRATGQIALSPRDTRDRAGLNLREFTVDLTNHLNDRMYFATPSGLLLCLRESGQIVPRPLRDAKGPKFGYLPPNGVIQPVAPPPVEPAEGDADKDKDKG
jgi:outer membrane protein assembly factor BamB